jgi:hypothetical protein
MNEFFGRKYISAHAPERHLGRASVLSPATAVVTFFEKASDMPKMVKNEHFNINDCGLPDAHEFAPHACALLYLAPADYHCALPGHKSRCC